MTTTGAGEGEYWTAASQVARRRCDTCKEAPALVYCRADAGYLCGTCDGSVHGPAPRHERVWVCEVCEQAPASFTCKADAANLCVACDADVHSANPLARRHERAPIVPFVGPVAASAAVATAGLNGFLFGAGDVDSKEANKTGPTSWLLGGPDDHGRNPKGTMELPELKTADYFFSDVDPYLDLDHAPSVDGRFQQNDSVVPVRTKAAGFCSGDAAVVPPPNSRSFTTPDGGIELDFTGAKYPYNSYTVNSVCHSVSSSEVGVVPDGSGSGGALADVTNPYGGSGGARTTNTAADREARVMRYREKRKNRRFEKTIRYASRKAYAETRPRIKGRFAKRSEMETDTVSGMYAPSAATALMVDSGYGVVPSF